jgi:hypothetical protein
MLECVNLLHLIQIDHGGGIIEFIHYGLLQIIQMDQGGLCSNQRCIVRHQEAIILHQLMHSQSGKWNTGQCFDL